MKNMKKVKHWIQMKNKICIWYKKKLNQEILFQIFQK